MKIKNILLFSLLFTYLNLHAQDDSIQQNEFEQIYLAAEQEYGIDQEFVNGIHFQNFYNRSIGHPYLIEDAFRKGSVTYHGKLYSDVILEYDIYNQLLLIYYTFNNVELFFYLTNEFVTEFTIQHLHFIKHSFPGQEKDRFYQIIGSDSPKVLYKWEKLVEQTSNIRIPYKFTYDMRKRYLLFDNTLIRFRGNNSFIRKFPKQHQKAIRKFIHRNKIKIKYSTEEDMESILDYFKTITQTK